MHLVERSAYRKSTTSVKVSESFAKFIAKVSSDSTVQESSQLEAV